MYANTCKKRNYNKLKTYESLHIGPNQYSVNLKTGTASIKYCFNNLILLHPTNNNIISSKNVITNTISMREMICRTVAKFVVI